MNFLARLRPLLLAFGLALPLLSGAQTSPPISDAERARRDAEKVFSFIKFKTVRSRPAGEPSERPAAPRERPASPPLRAVIPTAPATPKVTGPASTGSATGATVAPPAPAAEPAVMVPPAALAAMEPQPSPSAASGPATTAATSKPAAEPEPDGSDGSDDEADDAALQLQRFVAPVLSPQVSATLAAGSTNVKVRFTVEADGRVSSAEAAAGVPRRLAKPSTEAILQWRFAPLPKTRTVDVEIAFRRD